MKLASPPDPLDPTVVAERLRRWRLLLGGASAEGTGHGLAGADIEIDRALAALYDPGLEGGDDLRKTDSRQGGSGPSRPGVARWLGDIRQYFPSTVVRVMQKDALERLHLQIVPSGTFVEWMKQRGKFGGQHKVPRLANHREYAEDLMRFLHS